MRGKKGALKVKPEIGPCDNKFKEQRNHNVCGRVLRSNIHPRLKLLHLLL